MYLDQITRNTDGAYYDMLSIMNYMGPGGLVGNVTDSYLGATDNFDRFIEQRTLREEMAGLGYVNTKLVGVMYYDREEKKELISGMNVRALDGSHASLPEVVECAGNVIQAAHPVLPKDRLLQNDSDTLFHWISYKQKDDQSASGNPMEIKSSTPAVQLPTEQHF